VGDEDFRFVGAAKAMPLHLPAAERKEFREKHLFFKPRQPVCFRASV